MKTKPSSKSSVSPQKAKEILKDGHISGMPLTEKQKGYFGAIAGKDKKK